MSLSAIFLAKAPALLEREGNGQYTDRAADRGGPTRWGVTAAALGAWRKLGRPATAQEVQALGRDEALAILNDVYFVQPGFDRVGAVSVAIASEMLDSAVNLGPTWPSRWLQEVLNLCNRQQRDYPDVPVSGGVGPLTMSALQGLVRARGLQATEQLVVKCLNGEQYGRYKAITLAGGPNSDQEQNFCGWIAQRIGFN